MADQSYSCYICSKQFEEITEMVDHTTECRKEQWKKKAELLRKKLGKLETFEKIIFLFEPDENWSSVDLASEIIPQQLYLGDSGSSRNMEFLKSKGIKAVVNMAMELKPPVLLYEQLSIQHIHIEIDDYHTEDLVSHLDKVIAFLKKVDGPILFHCAAGVSRSTTMLTAYLMTHKKMPLLEALTMVKKNRSIVYPNRGFFKQLIELEHKLSGSSQHFPIEILGLHHDMS
jgi:protein-tyrosine phosphatase